MPNQSKKKVSGARNSDRRNGKAPKQRPQAPCRATDHGPKSKCKAHPGKTQGGRTHKAWTRHFNNAARHLAREEATTSVA